MIGQAKWGGGGGGKGAEGECKKREERGEWMGMGEKGWNAGVWEGGRGRIGWKGRRREWKGDDGDEEKEIKEWGIPVSGPMGKERKGKKERG